MTMRQEVMAQRVGVDIHSPEKRRSQDGVWRHCPHLEIRLMSKKQQESLGGSGHGVGGMQVYVKFHKQKNVFQEGGNHLLCQVLLVSEMRTKK